MLSVAKLTLGQEAYYEQQVVRGLTSLKRYPERESCAPSPTRLATSSVDTMPTG